MVFTQNQATQFYVVNKVTDKTTVAATNDEIKQLAKTDAFISKTADGKLYLRVKGADTVLRTDLVDPASVMQCKGTKAENMRTKLKKATIKFSDDHGTTPIIGQDYVMHIIVRQYQGISDEQNMVKSAAVHVTSAVTDETEFYKRMKESLELNFKRELNQFFEFTSDASGVVITEKEQDWRLGLFEQVPVYFDVIVKQVTKNGAEVVWGTVEYGESTTEIKNGHKIADMEYFYMGERGDQYRMIGWPNYIPTEYLVDPTKEYHTLNIHFAYVGENEGVQKSEKDIMIVSTDKTVIDTIGQAFSANYKKIGV